MSCNCPRRDFGPRGPNNNNNNNNNIACTPARFFPQMLMGGQQRDAREVLWDRCLCHKLVLGSDLEFKRPGEKRLFLPASITISARSNKFASNWPRL